MHAEMEEYLEIEAGKDKSDSTLTEYRKGLELFSTWLAENGSTLEEVDLRTIQRYLSYLNNEKGYANATIRLKYAAVNQFFRDYVANGGAPTNPCEHIRLKEYAPKTTKKQEATNNKRIYLTQDEVSMLVENVPSPSLRNRLLILFQYYTGLRRQEVVDVRLTDLDREERQVSVRGKRDVIHTAYWQPKLDSLLTHWLDHGYRTASPYAQESEYLFLTESSPKLSPSRLNDIVKEAAENAGLQEQLGTDAQGNTINRVTSHVLRHSFGMHYLLTGGSLEGLQKLLAHSSVETTQIYGEMRDDVVAEEYKGFNPDIEF